MKRELSAWLWRVWLPLPVWRRLDAFVLLLLLYSVVVKLVCDEFFIQLPKWLGDIQVVNAVILSVLLAFRNREAYDRWWEARKLWGQLINDSRNLCLKVRALTVGDAEQAAFGRLVVGFAVAAKFHLRGGKPLQDVPGFETAKEHPRHVPLQLAEWAFSTLRGWQAAGMITEYDQLRLDPHVKAFMDVCGACERIRSSPVPLSYRALLRHGTILYLLSAPWFLTGEYGYLGLLFEGLLAYFLLGIELTAEDVEEPFGKDGDDLELTRFCETIRDSVEQIFGDIGLASSRLTTTLIPRIG